MPMRYCGVERADFPDREFRDIDGVPTHHPPGGRPHPVPSRPDGPPLPGYAAPDPPAPPHDGGADPE